MTAKLIKHEVDYYCLLNNKGKVIADINGGDIDKLSLKNCQAIEHGSDSLQQNEWEVEIEMEEVNIGDKYTPDSKPKLDADGCLILKTFKSE